MPVAGVPWGQERGALATTVAQGEAPPPTHVGGGRAATTSRNYCGHPPDAARPLDALFAYLGDRSRFPTMVVDLFLAQENEKAAEPKTGET